MHVEIPDYCGLVGQLLDIGGLAECESEDRSQVEMAAPGRDPGGHRENASLGPSEPLGHSHVRRRRFGFLCKGTYDGS